MRDACSRVLASDRRGVAAMEFGILAGVIILLLLPIADVAAAAITYIRVDQAMRNVAAWAQYNPPPDITKPATWPKLPNSMSGFAVVARADNSPPAASAPSGTISIYVTVRCGVPPGAACTATDASTLTTVRWYYLSTKVLLNPIFLPRRLGGVFDASGHAFSYSERF
jgi:Flp pilus assembly protein TadG